MNKNKNKKRLIAILVMFTVASIGLFTAEQTTTVDIPFVPDVTINGNKVEPLLSTGVLYNSSEVFKQLKNAFPAAKLPIMPNDRNFEVPTHDSMKRFINSVNRLYWNMPLLRYHPEFFDCDNFARMAVTLGDLATLSNEEEIKPFKGQVAIMRIYVNQKNEWAGVPAGGGHALNIFISDRGVFVYEPQNGRIIEAENYPNRKYVLQVLTD